MTLVSLVLITIWLALEVLGLTFSGFVHLFMIAATAIVFLTGNRTRSRVADATAR